MHRIHSLTLATALAVAFTGASAASAQTPQPQDQSQKPSQPATRDAAKTTTASTNDREFVQKAAASGRMEVEHGKMAASKASNTEVKAFGNTLVKDHTAANQELMAIAKRKNIAVDERQMGAGQPPAGGTASTATTDTKTGSQHTAASGTTGTTGASGGVVTTGERGRDQQKTEPWMSATGAAFDRGFIEAQVKAHQDAIALFEKQANGGNDGDLKAFAQKQLPALRGHLKQAQDLQKKLATSTQ